MAKKQTLEQVEASMARWQTRLRRAVTMIDKLGKQKKRLAQRGLRAGAQSLPPAPRAPVPPVARPEPLAVTILKEMAASAPAPAASNGTEKINMPDDDIPAFLRRQKPGDPVAEQIMAEQAERKAAKARGRIATMKAKKSGETRRMPLTGKAALAAIRG